MSKILVLKNPSGIKRTIEFSKSASLADVFSTASKQFNLDQNTHELKLGPKTLNLNATIESSIIPETVVLEIAPRTKPRINDVQEVLVQMGFSDEGYLYENCSKVMNGNCTLWDVVKVMVPSHMAYNDEDVCLTYLGIKYKGKKRLRTLKLIDLCGRERQMFFTCSRNYLQKAYKRTAVRDDRKKATKMISQSTQPESDEEPQHFAEPTMGNLNPGVVELNERLGRLYHGKYISNFIKSGELGKERSSDSVRRDFEESKMFVRIVFPNMAVMEGIFSNHETINDVANFVKTYLVEEAKLFYFYTVQPRLIISPTIQLKNMRSSPPRTLWYCGKFESELFPKDIKLSLEGKVFSYAESDVPEESKIDLRATSSMYVWKFNKNASMTINTQNVYNVSLIIKNLQLQLNSGSS